MPPFHLVQVTSKVSKQVVKSVLFPSEQNFVMKTHFFLSSLIFEVTVKGDLWNVEVYWSLISGSTQPPAYID
jgi:hypothetical protein